MEHAFTGPPLWLRILQFPLTRLIVLGGVSFYMMVRAEIILNEVKDSPVLAAAIAIVLALLGMAVYIAWGKLIERREVTELSLAGAGREWGIGALIGIGLYTGCVLLLMMAGAFTVEGLNPLSYPS